MFGALIIGDELLVGKREDKHLGFLIRALANRGLRLDWAHYLGDDPARLTDAAAALGVPLKLHPEAEREIRARFPGQEVTPQRLAMGEFPQGAKIIPNPVNRIPGFSLADHHFVPGFPQMAWPMAEWVLDTRYRDRFDSQKWAEESMFVYEVGESQLIPAMKTVESEFKGVKVFSLPSMGAKGERIHVELGVRGEPAQVAPAMERLKHEVRSAGFPYK